MTTATHTKRIVFDRETKDFAAYLNGEYIGSFGTHTAAELALDQVAYDQLMDGVALTAAELDGGSDVDALAEGAMGSYNGRTTIDSPEPNALTVKEAQTLLSAINTAHRNGLDVSGMRGWLSSHGHATVLGASGLFVLTAPHCEYCDGTGLIPNGSGTGDQSGGWADTCECQDPEPPSAPTPAPRPYPGPLPPYPYPLTDAAEFAAELSAVDGVPLSEARELAAAHLGHITRDAARVRLVNWSDRVHCRTCGSDRHLTSACPITARPARSGVAHLRRDSGW